MILHLFIDDKFPDYTIKQFEPYNNSVFLYVKESPSEQIRHIKQQDKLTVMLRQSEEYKYLLSHLNDYAAIIVHGMYTPWQAEVTMAAPVSVKLAWMMWGGDVYQRLDIRDTFLSPWNARLSKLHSWYKPQSDRADYMVPREVFMKMQYVLTDELEEYQIASSYFQKTDWKFIWYNYYSLEETIGALMSEQVSGNNVLLGHMAGIRSNQVDGLLFMRKFRKCFNKCIIPLSYGEPWYRNVLLKIGRWLLGKQFNPLLHFMPREEYNQLLVSCSAVVLPTYKPEGMGNCLTALWMGARLYMYKRNAQYQFFKRLGLKIFTIEDDLNKNNPDAFQPISSADMAHNREILKREYGFAEMNVRVKFLIAELER